MTRTVNSKSIIKAAKILILWCKSEIGIKNIKIIAIEESIGNSSEDIKRRRDITHFRLKNLEKIKNIIKTKNIISPELFLKLPFTLETFKSFKISPLSNSFSFISKTLLS